MGKYKLYCDYDGSQNTLACLKENKDYNGYCSSEHQLLGEKLNEVDYRCEAIISDKDRWPNLVGERCYNNFRWAPGVSKYCLDHQYLEVNKGESTLRKSKFDLWFDECSHQYSNRYARCRAAYNQGYSYKELEPKTPVDLVLPFDVSSFSGIVSLLIKNGKVESTQLNGSVKS